MLVYFNNFWNGFLEKTDPVNVAFFIKLLSTIYNTEITISNNMNNSDILVESIFGNNSYITYKKWKYSFLFTGESYYSEMSKQYIDNYTCVLGFQSTHNNFVECPLFIPYMICNSCDFTPIQHIPLNAASVVISNSSGQERNLFLDKLEKQISLLYGGSYKNNIGGSINGTYHSDNLINFYKKTRFTVTMENSREDYYITEKIINGFRAGNIPIYWGSPYITKYFNPKRFLLLENTSENTITQLIEKIITITDNEYISIINEPILNISIDELFNKMVESIKVLLA